jgi:hypothetical protein
MECCFRKPSLCDEPSSRIISSGSQPFVSISLCICECVCVWLNSTASALCLSEGLGITWLTDSETILPAIIRKRSITKLADVTVEMAGVEEVGGGGPGGARCRRASSASSTGPHHCRLFTSEKNGSSSLTPPIGGGWTVFFFRCEKIRINYQLLRWSLFLNSGSISRQNPNAHSLTWAGSLLSIILTKLKPRCFNI